MSKLLKSKILLGVVIVAILCVGFVVTTSVKAADCSLTKNLKYGMTDAEVVCLQAKLGMTVSSTHFGNLTKAAVIAYQTSKGIVPNVGYVGAITRAALNAEVTATVPASTECPAGMTCTPAAAVCPAGFTCTPSTGGTTPTLDLQGGAWDISVSSTSTNIESQVSEGSTENVVGFKIEATDSDVAIKNLKVTLNNAASDVTAGGSYRLADYASKVEVYMGTTLVGSADTADFTKDVHSYSKSMTLTDAIVREGSSKKATFYVKVVAASGIDSNDIDHNNWTILVDNIRFQDATGVIMTGSGSATKVFSFTNLSGLGDLKLSVSKGSGSPLVGPVQVTENSGTTDVKMLEFKLKATGSDLSFDQVALTVDGTPLATTVADMLDSLYLKNGSDELASINTNFVSNTDASDEAGTQAYVFNLDNTYTISQDATDTFTVYAKIRDINSFTAGSLTISLPNDAVNAEDSNGDLLTTTENSGTVAGNAQTFYAKGISASEFHGSTVVDTVEAGKTIKERYTVTFKVTALGENYYIPKAWSGFTVETDAGVTQTSGEVARVNSSLSSSATLDGDYYLVSDGSTETFTTSITLSSGSAAGYFHAQLGTLGYATDAAGTDLASYSFAPASSYETADSYLDHS